MSIRTKETQVPSEFPPARLFLDDIEEVVRVFRELVETINFSEHWTAEELVVKTIFAIGNKECDDVQDLPKISGRTKTNSLEIRVSKGPIDTSLRLHHLGSLWHSSGFTRENAWKAFHKIQPVFKAKSTLWRSFVHSVPRWLLSGSGLILWLFVAFLRFAVKLQISDNQASAIFWLIFTFIAALLASKLLLHTTVVMRYSWEPSLLRRELLHKIPLVAITAALTFLLTLLGFYIKHKFWP